MWVSVMKEEMLETTLKISLKYVCSNSTGLAALFSRTNYKAQSFSMQETSWLWRVGFVKIPKT